MAIDGSTIVVGASGDDDGADNSGSVYVLRTTDGGATYVELAKLTASDPEMAAYFGKSVAIDGDTIVVGSPYDDDAGSQSGSVYVFRTSNGWATHTEIELTAADTASGDLFGRSVAIDGNTIVVGTSNADAVYVFRTTDGGATYDELAKLTASDAAEGDWFGLHSVAIDGDTIVVSARQAPAGGRARSTTARRLLLRQPVLPRSTAPSTTVDDAAEGDWFGGLRDRPPRDVAIVVRRRRFATYGQVAKLTADDAAADDEFGRSVAIDGDTVVIGSLYDDDGGSYSGAAHVFRTTDGGATYDELAKLTASDAAEGDRFGWSVAIDGGTIVVGTPYDDDAGLTSGSAYVFLTTDGGATYGQVAKLTASDGAASDYFGYSVAISGGTVVVGAYWDDDGGYSSGSVYVFSGAGSEGLVAGSDSTQTLGSDAATRTGPLLALLVAAVLALVRPVHARSPEGAALDAPLNMILRLRLVTWNWPLAPLPRAGNKW